MVLRPSNSRNFLILGIQRLTILLSLQSIDGDRLSTSKNNLVQNLCKRLADVANNEVIVQYISLA